MKIFNLSDATPPYKPERRARDLKVKGVQIKPGEFGEVPDSVPTSDFSGLIVSNMVSINHVPDWYTVAKQARQDAALPSREELDKSAEEQELATVVEVPEPEVEEPESKSRGKRPKRRKKS